MFKLFLFLLCLSMSIFSQENQILDKDGPGSLNITAYDRVSDRSIGGYFDTEYKYNTDSGENSFIAHRLILQVSSQLHQNILFNSEIEYEYGGFVTNKDSSSNVQKGEIKIEQAWFDFKLSGFFTQRAGIVLIPFGRINILHDSDARDTTERPLYSKYIIPSTWMDTGVGAYGGFDIADVEVFYEGYIINGISDTDSLSSDDISESKGIRSARPNFKIDNNKSKAIVGRLGISPMLNLELGTSLYRGAYDDNDDYNLTILGLDGIYNFKKHELVFEYADSYLGVKTSQPSRMRGYYIEYHYHTMQDQLKKIFTQFDSPVLTLFTRYGYVNTNLSTDYIMKEYVTGLNFRPVPSVVYKLEYQVLDVNNSSNHSMIGSVAVGF